MMIKISSRLSSLIKYIHPEDKIMDVGCDHAILDIYLVQAGVVKNIYVGDVNPNALANGKENIEKYELSANIFPILSYGIEKISEYDIDTLIISGMGAKTIVDILDSPNLDRVYKLILQANNNYAELRRFLASKNYQIVLEEIVVDGKKTYVNIVALKSSKEISYSEVEYELGPIFSKDSVNLEYFKNLLEINRSIYYASHSDEVREKIKYLEETIERLELASS
ncbi:MAG TPA: hypothetical protein DCY94_02025 [Firmicutes bacterium]|nr:hypothetical protein [Bacillota bacterium]